MQKAGSSGQLDLLLQKAETYSHFILENQKRTQSLLHTKSELASSSASKKQRSEEVHESTENSNIKTFEQPSNLVGGKLMGYQLEGLQWLLSLWENGLNGILADEMGLGKTIQIISLIAHLRMNNTSGPYLIAGPLATISNWVNEFKKWLPSCPVLLYHGTKAEREALRNKHMPVHDSKSMKFPVVITSFEMCIVDRPQLEQYVWQYIILDEGHRIKNRNCRLIKELKSIKSVSRLLLTGTPIQNSLEELWSLLNFCSPMIFDDLEVFQSWFDFKNIGQDTKVEDILSTEEQDRIVTKMHEILRPFVLRRIKTETLGDKLPPKREIVVYCGMSSLQREYYARVMDGTLRESLIEVGMEGAKKMSQINMLMNFRKVCNHPFLFGDLKDASTGESLSEASGGKLLVSASGKFKLLHRMLPRLKREGSKVLIFSQMTSLMDLLEDYLLLQHHSYVRFDGSTKLAERQRCIDEFNRKDSGVFIFLLSTRAGGLGINLTAADTVILFDSDWNPHQDSQAQDRCHRIGQTKRVVTYRLLTSGSVEIDMMRKQISKKKLERLTMQGGDYRKAGRREGQQQVSLLELRALLEDDVKNLHKRDKDTSIATAKPSAATDTSPEGTTSSGRKRKAAKNSAMDAALAVHTVDWIQRDISDAELDLIMNRDLLFPVGPAATSPGMKSKASSASLVSSADGSTSVETTTESTGAGPRNRGKGGALKTPLRKEKGKLPAKDCEEELVVLNYDEYTAATSACKSPVPRTNTTSTPTAGSSTAVVVDGDGADVPEASEAPDAATVAAWEAERERLELALPLEGEMYDIVTDASKGNHQLLSIK